MPSPDLRRIERQPQLVRAAEGRDRCELAEPDDLVDEPGQTRPVDQVESSSRVKLGQSLPNASP